MSTMGSGPGGGRIDSPDAAVRAMLAQIGPVGVERVGLEGSWGRVLGEEIRTDRPSPPADVSAMDGYALRLADAVRGEVPVAGEVRIGCEPPALPPGAALRIVTGAALPAGAEVVIKREDVEERGASIVIPGEVGAALRAGESVRREGENSPAGARVVPAGVVIGPNVAGALATVGGATPLVHRRVRVGVLVTGDELLPVEARASKWQIRDSNGAALACLLAGVAWAELVARRHAGDELDETTGALRELAGMSDVLFVTGGVSMGDRDHVPAALGALGARTLFHKLPQRPGKPVLGAVLGSGVPVLALPGNPVSVMVTARRLGAPVLRLRAGFASPLDAPRAVRAENPDEKRLELWWQRPARLTGGSSCELLPTKGSGDMMGTAGSDGFLEVPPGESAAGPWAFYPWSM